MAWLIFGPHVDVCECDDDMDATVTCLLCLDAKSI